MSEVVWSCATPTGYRRMPVQVLPWASISLTRKRLNQSWFSEQVPGDSLQRNPLSFQRFLNISGQFAHTVRQVNTVMRQVFKDQSAKTLETES